MCRQCYTLADKALFSAYQDLGSNCKEERACPKGSHYCMNFNVEGVEGEVGRVTNLN